MKKYDLNKIRGNFSEVEKFARKHVTESFTAAAILIGALSSWGQLFIGGRGLSILFISLGTIAGVYFPSYIDSWIKRLYMFLAGEKKMAEILVGVLKIAVALFIPFIYFGFLGLLAGSAYHYYTRVAQSARPKDLDKAA